MPRFLTLLLVLGIVVGISAFCCGGDLTSDSVQSCSATALFVSLEDSEFIERELLEEITRAKDSIYVAIYSFQNEHLAKGIIEASCSGVDVKVLVDEFASSKWNPRLLKFEAADAVLSLQAAGVAVNVCPSMGTRHLYHNFLVVDCRVVVTGSYNWSDSVDRSEFNNLVLINYPKLAVQFIEEFRRVSEEFGVNWSRPYACLEE